MWLQISFKELTLENHVCLYQRTRCQNKNPRNKWMQFGTVFKFLQTTKWEIFHKFRCCRAIALCPQSNETSTSESFERGSWAHVILHGRRGCLIEATSRPTFYSLPFDLTWCIQLSFDALSACENMFSSNWSLVCTSTHISILRIYFPYSWISYNRP